MTSSFKKNFLDGHEISWKPGVVHINNELFVVQRKMVSSKFIFGVLMLADRERCDQVMVTLGIQNNNSQTSFSAQFNPTPLSMENSDEAILVVEKKRFAKNVSEAEGSFKFDIEIKLSEKRALAAIAID